jgi:hypothetical protein
MTAGKISPYAFGLVTCPTLEGDASGRFKQAHPPIPAQGNVPEALDPNPMRPHRPQVEQQAEKTLQLHGPGRALQLNVILLHFALEPESLVGEPSLKIGDLGNPGIQQLSLLPTASQP